MKINPFYSIVLGAGFLVSSCTYSTFVEIPVIAPTEPISFKNQIEPIFSEQTCTGCHPSIANLDLTAGNAYNSLMGKAGRVDTLNPEASLIVTVPAPGGAHSKVYTTQQAYLILTWIEEGAKLDPVEVPTDTISYVNEVEPMFSSLGCTECHDAYTNLNLTLDNSYLSMMENSGVINKENPSASTIVTVPSSTSSHPKKFNAQQEIIVLTWIQQGAVYDEKPVVIPTDTLIFEDDIEPIFTAQACVTCHPNDANLDLTVGKALESLMGKVGRVDTLHPATSLIVTIPTALGSHPKKYTKQQEQNVLTWIEQGARHIEIPTEPISFSTQIVPIFSAQQCLSCHPASAGLDFNPANAYASIMAKEGCVNLQNPESSSLVTKPASAGTHFKKYTASQEMLVLTWIEEGAKNN